MQYIRIFFSSPSDVRDERELAKEVVSRLFKRFAHHCNIESLFWEEEPLRATASFQDEIPNPADYDIVILLLWSRLGKPLPKRIPYLDETGKSFTGTEWEFIEARKEFEASGGERPALLVYRKKAPIQISLDNEMLVQDALEQKKSLEEFWRKWFVDGEGDFTTASHSFSDRAEFESLLEEHLRRTIRQILEDRNQGQLSITEDSWGIEQHGSPFRGLASFDVNDSPIFFGRTKARFELRELLRKRIKGGMPALLVVGPSGAGKSSLIRAGLIADLKKPDVIGRVALCRHAELRPSDAQGDLIKALAKSIQENSALPEILRTGLNQDKIAKWLQDDPERVVNEIKEALQVALDVEKATGHAEAKLIIFIDQLEELFTFHANNVLPFVKAIQTLIRSGHVWVISALRGDFFHRLDDVPELKSLFKPGIYHLDVPSQDELSQMIRKPAEIAGLTFEKDELTGSTLAAEIEKEAADNPYALPLVEFALELLFQERDRANVMKYGEYRRFDGLSGAIARHAEGIVETFDEPTESELEPVLRSLVTIASPESEATAIWADKAQLTRTQRRKKIVEAFLNARLLVSKGEESGARVRVTHEALINYWSRFRQVVDANRNFLLMQSEFGQLATKYMVKKDPSFLLWGNRLAEAQSVFKDRYEDLDATIIKLLEDSIQANQDREERERRIVIERAENAERIAEQQKQIVRRVRRGRTIAVTLLFFVLCGFVASAYLYYEERRQAKILQTSDEFHKKLARIDILLAQSRKNKKPPFDDFLKISKGLSDLEGTINQDVITDRNTIITLTELTADRRVSALISWNRHIDKKVMLKSVEETVALYTSVKKHSFSTELKNRFSKMLEKVGGELSKRGKYDEAVEYYKNAISIREHILEVDPLNTECKCIIMSNYGNIAFFYNELQLYNQANTALQSRLQLAQLLNKEEPKRPDWKQSIAESLLSLSRLPKKIVGDKRDKYAQEAADSWLEITKSAKTARNVAGLISSLTQSARIHYEEKRSSEADKVFAYAFKISESLTAPKNKDEKAYLETIYHELTWLALERKLPNLALKLIAAAHKNKALGGKNYLLASWVASTYGNHKHTLKNLDTIKKLKDEKLKQSWLKTFSSEKEKLSGFGYNMDLNAPPKEQKKISPPKKEPQLSSESETKPVDEPKVKEAKKETIKEPEETAKKLKTESEPDIPPIRNGSRILSDW